MLRKIHQSLIHQGKSVLRKIQQSLIKKVCFADKTNITSPANIDSYKTNSNEKKLHVMKQGAVKKNMLGCVIVG